MNGRHVVAAIGIGSVAAIEVTALLTKGPDGALASAVVGAITFITGLCFGIRKGKG